SSTPDSKPDRYSGRGDVGFTAEHARTIRQYTLPGLRAGRNLRKNSLLTASYPTFGCFLHESLPTLTLGCFLHVPADPQIEHGIHGDVESAMRVDVVQTSSVD
ncbi:hypothetical protein, partial [Xanthomonas citri]|uniref:hypothetical protein n=2 Tax=Xanthomonas citri TaxID=346 RepID=UPI003CCF0262